MHTPFRDVPRSILLFIRSLCILCLLASLAASVRADEQRAGEPDKRGLDAPFPPRAQFQLGRQVERIHA